MSSIADRLELVRERIRAAAERAGRASSEVRLIAVSKTHSYHAVREAYACGQREFGENYVQELSDKAAALADLPDLRWHMIGHLQRNKARHVVRVASAVHSVDSAELAVELGKRTLAGAGAGAGVPARLQVLVEVNIGNEPQKHGVKPEELTEVLKAVESQPALELRGLMCVPPVADTAESARPYFDALVALRDSHGGKSRLPELSMGMTHDLEQAIGAGATLVRVGTAIFGDRPVKG